MNDVDVFLADSTGTIIGTTTTNSSGNYEFTDLPDGNYVITFSTDANAGGVNLIDAFKVMWHLFFPNYYPFNELQELAADVNSDGSVDWDDYFEILYSYLNQGNPLSGGAWDFTPTEVTLPGESRTGVTTGGISNGDVNGTFQPTKNGTGYVNCGSSMPVYAEPMEAATLNLQSDQLLEIAGMHLVFSVPENLVIESISTSLPGMQISRIDNEIRITGMPDDLTVLRINPSSPFIEFVAKADKNSSAGEFLTLQLKQESHFIGTSGEMLPLINLSLPGIVIEEITAIAVTERIYPNPFLSYATLDYELPYDGKVKIIVTNSAGQLIQIVTDEVQTAGFHQVRINGANWPTGIYQYGIYLSGNKSYVKTGSMIKSK
jgi:hypothetical protein